MKTVRPDILKSFFRLTGVLFVLVMLPFPAQALCTAPAGDHGDIFYNRDHKIMQYCNGTDWIGMGGGTPGCALPWGGSITTGSSVTAYQAASAASCTSETRTCNNGTLSGSFAHSSCTATCTPGYQKYTSSGSLTVNSGCSQYRILIVGGGGGGTSGHQGGGGSGNVTKLTKTPAQLGTSVSITVGAGGSGAPSVSSNETTAQAGGQTCFGTTCVNGGGVTASVNGGGHNGFSGGGGAGNSGNPGGNGGTCGGNGASASGSSMPIGNGTGAQTFTEFTQQTVTCGSGGNGGTTSHAGGGGGGGILVGSGSANATAGCAGCGVSGCGGAGYGGGGGAGGYPTTSCASMNYGGGGTGAGGIVYVEWQ